ncbi:16S rRNA (uracil(1498)-N(3))-methyltransferase [Entomospira nematocerorum]|uniref:Ribosomal RNA small subunit methyltransferase E n=1 Tax=Entomospira nematocerorum TaxID=2719987 RepID=A0A968GER8_9SPIO|nr:16S rRNA (uracil(1498)-N(3))-methyltransferase [Entomospira nematocera]NIZ46945.1 16S rRNA (uracil(1498)-N(3))-methyltransferase [Entomospira nematocera]WDI34509.1 16S rRNA (uracil(1498)-N(3))-methyltransferase [Entomospira nematocera]
MRFIWIEATTFDIGDVLTLDSIHSRHLRDVRRVKVGDYLKAHNMNSNQMANVIVQDISKQGVTISIESIEIIPTPRVQIDLVQGYPKASKFDDVLRMAIEAGVRRVTPVWTQYADVRQPGGAQKVDRWMRVAREAVEQSGNTQYTHTVDVMALSDFFRLTVPSETTLEVICHPMSASDGHFVSFLHHWRDTFNSTATTIRIFVGPEGGFSPSEVEEFQRRGAYLYSFGDTIVRSEHAGIYAIAGIKTLIDYKGYDV